MAQAPPVEQSVMQWALPSARPTQRFVPPQSLDCVQDPHGGTAAAPASGAGCAGLFTQWPLLQLCPTAQSASAWQNGGAGFPLRHWPEGWQISLTGQSASVWQPCAGGGFPASGLALAGALRGSQLPDMHIESALQSRSLAQALTGAQT